MTLSLTVFEIFAKIAFLTFDLGPRSKVMASNESPYMISYICAVPMVSLPLIIFEIFVKIAFLTFVLGPTLKVMALNENPNIISYTLF